MWVDGVYVKAGLEKDKAFLLVIVGGLVDGRKVVLAVEPGYRESTERWSDVLRHLKERGMNFPRLVIGDGNLGIWGALSNVYPDAAGQRCWNHKIVNVLDKLPKRVQPQAKRRLQDIAYAESQPEAEEKRDLFLVWCQKEGQRAAGDTPVRDWDRMVTFYQFPKEHWKHPSDDQRSRIAVCGSEVKDECGQAIQEGGKRHGGNLENAYAGGAKIPKAGCTGEVDPSLPGV